MHHAVKHMKHIVSAHPQLQSHIIIADDDPSVLMLLKHVLISEGHIVTEAHSGIEAIELCQHNNFDLAVFDIIMPGMTGYEACQYINKHINRPPPVLLITSIDDDLSVDQAFSCGATEYISKPINWSVLKHRVQRILESQQSRQTIQRLEYLHPLTGLPNRVLMLDRLESATIRATHNETLVALLMVDIDNFKLINDTLGHDIGDLLLKSVSQRLENAIRETDTLAHIGGDEFAIIIENFHRIEDIASMAEHLSHTLEHDVTLSEQTVHIKASIGITVFPQDGNDIGTLLRNADIALYRAKERGRNLYQFFSPDLSMQALQRLNLENSLRKAIENHELVLYYQPKIRLDNSCPDSMEALVRWKHPSNGLILPDAFIPIAEETGLIVPLGEWVIKTACRQFNEWLRMGVNVTSISINVSARQFKEQNLVSIFQKLFDETQLNPQYIELEITESALLQDEHCAESKLNTLHDMGIRIAIDDFGTGYASLSYLKRLPLDTLKIDCSFTDGFIHDSDDHAIVLAIVGLAKAMGMKLVAEGIESKAQLQKYMELDVDYGQGFYWSAARAAEDYLPLLKQLGNCQE